MSMAASRTIPLERPEQIDLPQAARYLGARGGPDPATLALLERCASPLLAAAAPRAVYLRAPKEDLSALWQGADVERHLADCPEAVLLAVTLGPGVDAQIRRAGVGDVAAQAATDALASTLAEQVCDPGRGKAPGPGPGRKPLSHRPLFPRLRGLGPSPSSPGSRPCWIPPSASACM